MTTLSRIARLCCAAALAAVALAACQNDASDDLARLWAGQTAPAVQVAGAHAAAMHALAASASAR